VPYAQRTGVPISCRFSSSKTLNPRSAAILAAIDPPGPAPTTTTSYFGFTRGIFAPTKLFFSFFKRKEKFDQKKRKIPSFFFSIKLFLLGKKTCPNYACVRMFS
jgi:hypothetical protein